MSRSIKLRRKYLVGRHYKTTKSQKSGNNPGNNPASAKHKPGAIDWRKGTGMGER